MGSFEVESTRHKDAFNILGDFDEKTDEAMDDMLVAQAEVFKKKIKYNATAMLNEKGFSKRLTAESVTVGKPKRIRASKGRGKQISIYFRGSRNNGDGKAKNSEVAFLNEFGTKKMPGRQFIKSALVSEAETAEIEMTKEFDNLLREIYDE